MDLLKPLIGEIGGTFILLLIILKVSGSSYRDSTSAALPIGLGLALAIFIFGKLSLGHFNPIISLVNYRKDPHIFTYITLIIYIIGQLIGGFLALLVDTNFKKF